MLKNRIIYITVILLLLLFRIAYTGYVAGLTLVMILVLPLFSWCISLPGAFSTTIRLNSPDQVQRGSDSVVSVSLRQSQLFLTGPMKGSMLLVSADGSTQNIRLKTGTNEIPISTDHCDSFHCSLKSVRIYEFMGLLPLPLKSKTSLDISVMPIPSEPPEHPDWSSGSTQVSKPYSGNNYPYDLREYRMGDTMRSIHWKKSAALDKTVVRESLEPAERTAIIWIDWTTQPAVRDYVLDQLAWCIIYLKQNNAGICVKWYDNRGAEQLLYADQGHLDDIIPQLLCQPPGSASSFSTVKQGEILLSCGAEGGNGA